MLQGLADIPYPHTGAVDVTKSKPLGFRQGVKSDFFGQAGHVRPRYPPEAIAIWLGGVYNRSQNTPPEPPVQQAEDYTCAGGLECPLDTWSYIDTGGDKTSSWQCILLPMEARPKSSSVAFSLLSCCEQRRCVTTTAWWMRARFNLVGALSC